MSGCCGVIVAVVVAVVLAFGGGEALGTVGTLEDFVVVGHGWPGSDLGGEELSLLLLLGVGLSLFREWGGLPLKEKVSWRTSEFC